jgi:hypothetical protein
MNIKVNKREINIITHGGFTLFFLTRHYMSHICVLNTKHFQVIHLKVIQFNYLYIYFIFVTVINIYINKCLIIKTFYFYLKCNKKDYK